MLATELAYDNRRNPSPQGPKAVPARDATPASLEQPLGQHGSRHPGSGNVGKCVERPVRQRGS